MGYSTYYLALPRTAVDELRARPAQLELLEQFWHLGSGAWFVLDELDAEELEELIGDLDLEEAETAVAKYRALLEETNRKFPAVVELHAYLENTHDIHELLLRDQLERVSCPNAIQLAAAAIDGREDAELLGELRVIDEATVQAVGAALRGVNIEHVQSRLASFPTSVQLGNWEGPDHEKVAYLKSRATDQDLAGEVDSPWNLFADAAELGFVVILG